MDTLKSIVGQGVLLTIKQRRKHYEFFTGRKQQAKKTRYSHLSSFLNFIKTNLEEKFDNPCDVPMMKKLFKAPKITHWDIIEKETVDEVIFRTMKARNRLILELMARGGMRVGEVLKLTLSDIHDQKLILRDPKSGKEYEYVFIPVKVSERLRDYAKTVCEKPGDRVFPISYEAARIMVIKAGKLAGIHLRPHDLRRHSAIPQGGTSRSGVPIEIVSKIILRHSNLSTTERYLGKISDVEAMKWIDTLYA